MKLSEQKPSNWDKLVALFGADWRYTVVTYGETVHSRVPITPDLYAHESVHVKQQLAYGVEAWWERYYIDIEFRVNQELEAYREQFQFFKRQTKDRNKLFRVLDKLARDLSSQQYGRCMPYDDALRFISEKPKAVAA